MLRYKFTYRRWIFWKTEMVSGHKYEEKIDKMVIYYPDGGLKEIKHWKNCELKLGADWFAQTKKAMENSIGQNIPVNVEEK